MVKVIRPTNGEFNSASYLPNGKAYKVQIWNTDGARRPVSQTSTMTSTVKGQGHQVDYCWDRKYIYRTGRLTIFKIGTLMKHALSGWLKTQDVKKTDRQNPGEWKWKTWKWGTTGPNCRTRKCRTWNCFVLVTCRSCSECQKYWTLDLWVTPIIYLARLAKNLARSRSLSRSLGLTSVPLEIGKSSVKTYV